MFTLKIKTDNAAFVENKGAEVARIMRELAKRIEETEKDNGYVLDINGNTVGTFKLN